MIPNEKKVKPVLLDRLPPQDLEAEKSLLGSLLLSREALAEVIELIGPDSFYRETHKKIYQAILDLYLKDEPVDAITVADNLKSKGTLEEVGDKYYLSTLVAGVPTAANAAHYARIIERNATLRNLIRAATEIAQTAYEAPEDVKSVIERADSLIYGISQGKKKEYFVSMKELASEGWDNLTSILERGEGITGISSGFKELDKYTYGFQKSDLIVLAARPSVGKTSLALSIARNIGVDLKIPVVIFSLEMSRQQLFERLWCMEAKVDLHSLRMGDLRDDEVLRMTNALHKIEDAPIYVDESSDISIFELKAKLRRLDRDTGGIGLVILDYLQLMRMPGKNENRVQEVSEISRALKILARELNVPLLAISQLSRAVEKREGKKPQLSDLRESGAIEQDADLVIFLSRKEEEDEEFDSGEVDIIIAKHRNGPVGRFKLYFVPKHTRFISPDEKIGGS